MRVVQVIDHLNVGGAERVLVDLANLLHENKYDTTVLCLLDIAKLDKDLHKGIPVIYFRRQNKFNPLYLKKLYKELKQFDIIHIHLRHVLRYTSLLFYVWSLHKKSVVIFHDHYGRIDVDKEISKSLKNAISRCAAYIGVSGQLTSFAEINNLNKRVFKLSNIVRSTPDNVNINRNSDKIQLVTVGNFRSQKNYEFLCELISKSPNNYEFTIYGQIVDIEYYNSIIKLIQQFNITNKVTLITDCDSIKTELSKYSLALHCATSETGPLVVLEYMSQQLPFVTYKTGEVIEDASHKFPELIMNNFNSEEWLKVIEDILNEKDTYKTKLKDYFTENYSDIGYLKKCISIYNTLLKENT